MEKEEIRRLCIKGSEKFYDFLEKNKKGIQTVEIKSIKVADEGKDSYLFNLSMKLFDLDAIKFRLLNLNKDFDTNDVRIVQYDRDLNNLLIRPEKSLKKFFENLTNKDIIIISDLKFLVERVKKWFEINGAFVELPSKVSILKEKWEKNQFFEDRIPSTNQLNALKAIFYNPFSYIWGAPGTGKTQIVLSYALMLYVQNNKKVAIFGPTNNAIEQVLRGVIEMTDRAKISRKKIIRLGNPSKKFVEDYQEVCEVSGVEKQLKELDNQIHLLQSVLEIKKKETDLENLKSFVPLSAKLDQIFENEINLNNQLSRHQTELSNLEKELKLRTVEVKKLEIVLEQLDKNSTSFLNVLNKFISGGKSSTEQKIKEKKEILLKIKNSIVDLKTSISQERYLIQRFDSELKENLEEKNRRSKEIINLNLNEEFIKQLKLAKDQSIENQTIELIKKEEQILSKIRPIAKEYSEYPERTIINRMDILKDKRESIAGFSTEERLKNVLIIASTLDCYIGRYTTQMMDVDHIFLDEAGYANTIKALTLFNHKTPITFLGDHMQLPPVCEMGDTEIENNENYQDVFVWSQSSIFIEGLFTKDKNTLLKQYLANEHLDFSKMKQIAINETFRFGPTLAKVLENYVYKNGFKSHNEFGQTEIFYVNAVFENGRRKRENPSEVNSIKRIIPLLIDSDYALLTPYRNQLDLLNKEFPKLKNEERIITVHGSQGREWNTVIISISDTYNKFFTDSNNKLSRGLNLMNTAVSRAKKKLIIVCDYRYWIYQEGQLIKALLETAKPFKME